MWMFVCFLHTLTWHLFRYPYILTTLPINLLSQPSPRFYSQDKIKGTNVALGGQNCYFMSEGAYTGAVSTCMLKDLGVTYVLAGR